MCGTPLPSVFLLSTNLHTKHVIMVWVVGKKDLIHTSFKKKKENRNKTQSKRWIIPTTKALKHWTEKLKKTVDNWMNPRSWINRVKSVKMAALPKGICKPTITHSSLFAVCSHDDSHLDLDEMDSQWTGDCGWQQTLYLIPNNSLCDADQNMSRDAFWSYMLIDFPSDAKISLIVGWIGHISAIVMKERKVLF